MKAASRARSPRRCSDLGGRAPTALKPASPPARAQSRIYGMRSFACSSARWLRPPMPRIRGGPPSRDTWDVPGVLALVGGDEFNPGNEEQDRFLAKAAGTGPAYVVPTAAARQGPERAVAHAQKWFRQFDLALEELPVLRRTDANSKELAGLAR